MVIYRTKEWKGHGKQNYYWNEYRQEGDTINKVKCNERKFFDGYENEWRRNETLETSWKTSDASLPDWLKRLVK